MSIFGIFMLVLLLFIYFIPAFVATQRKHVAVSAITLINLFLGWTLIGWLVSLIWAYSGQGDDRFPCPYCAESILRAANVCPHCQGDVAKAKAAAKQRKYAPKNCPSCAKSTGLYDQACRHCGQLFT